MRTFREIIKDWEYKDSFLFMRNVLQRLTNLYMDGKHPIFPNDALWNDVIQYMYSVGNNLKGDIIKGMNSGNRLVPYSIIHSMSANRANGFLHFTDREKLVPVQVHIRINDLEDYEGLWDYLAMDDLVVDDEMVITDIICYWRIGQDMTDKLYNKQMGLEQYLGPWQMGRNDFNVDDLGLCPDFIELAGKKINVLAYSRVRETIGRLLKHHIRQHGIQLLRKDDGRYMISYDLESFDSIKKLHNDFAGEEI